MLGDKLTEFFAFLGRFLCGFYGCFRRFHRIFRALTGLRRRVFLLDSAFLLPFGVRIGGIAFRFTVFFFESADICFVRCRFSAARFTVRFFLMGTVRGFRNTVTAFDSLRQCICRVSPGVIVIGFPDVPMDGAAESIHGSVPCGMGELGGRLLFFKRQARRDFPVGRHNALFHFLLRNFAFCLFQLVNRFVRFLSRLADYRVGQFFLRELKPWSSFRHRLSPPFHNNSDSITLRKQPFL